MLIRKVLISKREEFIEHEMKKKKHKIEEHGDNDMPQSNSVDASTSKKEATLPKNIEAETGSVVNRSGIVEIELPDTYVLKSIEETKKAAQKLREDVAKRSDDKNDENLDVPVNFNSDFKKRK